MRKSGVFLLAIVVLALCAPASQGALLSLYTFDDASTVSAANAVPGAPAMTYVNNLGIDAGVPVGPVGAHTLGFIQQRWQSRLRDHGKHVRAAACPRQA